MMDPDGYQEYAADCMRMAQAEETPEDRNLMLNLALAWIRLAHQRKALAAGIIPEDAQPGEELGL